METFILSALAIIFIVGCVSGLAIIIFAYYPDLWYEFKFMVYICWLKIKNFFSFKHLINGDLIAVENMIEKANPASLTDKTIIETMLKEIYNSGFDHDDDLDKYVKCRIDFNKKFNA